MGRKDPRIDAYIAKAQPFARPILKHLRKLVHQGCPKVEETLKWSMPHFVYAGDNLAGMASFKEHATFGFWKFSLIVGEGEAVSKVDEKAMGQFGRIAKLKDLPADARILKWVRKAAELNEQGIRKARPATRRKPELDVPDYFTKALRKNKAALVTFEAFSPSHRREYVEWVTEAKTDATRERRLAQAIEWMAEGKPRNWKYARC